MRGIQRQRRARAAPDPGGYFRGMRRSRFPPSPAVLAVALLAAAPAAAAAAAPKLYTGERPAFAVRPAIVSYTGDGSGFLGGRSAHPRRSFGRIHWTRWRSSGGHGTGRVWLNDCRPYCAAGHFHAHPMRVDVFRLRYGRFTRMTIRERFKGRLVIDRRKLTVYGGRYYRWGF